MFLFYFDGLCESYVVLGLLKPQMFRTRPNPVLRGPGFLFQAVFGARNLWHRYEHRAQLRHLAACVRMCGRGFSVGFRPVLAFTVSNVHVILYFSLKTDHE